MSYIDNTPLFSEMPERQVYSSNAKVWIGVLALGMAGTTIAVAIYINKLNKEKNAQLTLNNLANKESSIKPLVESIEIGRP